jgi:hypothetical protein
MKKTFVISIMVLFLCVQPAFADVTGSGSLNFTFTGALPDLVQFQPSTQVEKYPGSITYGAGTVTNGDSSASVTLGGPTMYYPGSTIYGTGLDPSVNPRSINTTSFNFTAHKPSGGTLGSAQVDVWGYFLYGGAFSGFGYGNDIATLPAFSYSYNFNGLADTSDDRMVFRVQFELANFINGDSNHPKTILYSDYDPAVQGYQSQMPEFKYPGFGPNISASNTVAFGPFTENVPHTWVMYWDLEGYIADYAQGQGTSAVPEPGTMLLLGLGLIGVAGIRRKLEV